MSIVIGLEDVDEVLLADGWHKVDWERDLSPPASTFDVDTLEFAQALADPIAATLGPGFCFLSEGSYIAGPLSSILAVRTHP